MKTKRNQPSNNRLKDLPKTGYEASNEEVRSSYLSLHVTSLVGASNPFFSGITLQGY
jgi:hypothetical protein